MPNSERVLSVLQETGAFLEGHFLLSSGLHSSRYVQCALALSFPQHARELAQSLAVPFKDENIDIVLGPALGGVVLAQEVGQALGVRAMFAEREKGLMSLRRGFKLFPGARILVVEDVITTGGSVKEVIELVGREKGIVKGLASIIDRSGGKVDFGVKWKSLIKLEIEAYSAETCPLCKEKIPLHKLGSR